MREHEVEELRKRHRMEFDVRDPDADDILKHIRLRDPEKEYTYIIVGRPGPTGKSTMYRKLKDLGYSAVEISEELLSVARVDGRMNAFILHNFEQRYALVVLNRFVL